MRPLKSCSLFEGSEGFFFSVLWICFGWAFIWIGCAAFASPTGLLNGGNGYFAYAPILFLLFGSMVGWGGVHQARLAWRFGKAEALVSEEAVRPGGSFRFRYQQVCRQQTSVEAINVFLVFRERVRYDDGSDTQTEDTDRMIQQFTHPPKVYSAGEAIREEHIFQVPARAMGIRNPLMSRKKAEVRTMWVVKIRIHLGKYVDVWKEYEVEVNGEPLEDNMAASQVRKPQFDLYLTSSQSANLLRITNVMSTLLPHLRDGQVGTLYYARPCLLLERMGEPAAQAAKAQLEAAGARVEVKPSA